MKYIICFIIFILIACKPQYVPAVKERLGLHLDHIPAMTPDSNINVLIEIPAGSIEKWEYDKTNFKLKRDSINGQPRSINYLGYPANYGMIPHTISLKEQGGDGDALDVIVLGQSLKSPSIVECKVFGVLQLKDRGETDDKILAVHLDSPMSKYSNLSDLDKNQLGLLDIIETWFVNYKGVDSKGHSLIKTSGYDDREAAMQIIKAALE